MPTRTSSPTTSSRTAGSPTSPSARSSDPATLGNCFAGNTFTTSAPTDLETLAPCDGEGAGDWTAGALDLGALHRRRRERPAERRLRRRPSFPSWKRWRTCPTPRRRRRRRRPTCPRPSTSTPSPSPTPRRSDRRAGRPSSPSLRRRRRWQPIADAGAGPQGRVGQFVVECGWSHSSFDDPIVHPGHAGASHRHDFFGNTSTSADVDLRTAARRADHLPAAPRHRRLLGAVAARRRRHADRADRGDGVLPRRRRDRPDDRRGVPTRPADAGGGDEASAGWTCRPGSARLGGAARVCATTAGLRLAVVFPDCWDGMHVDSADHRAHVAGSDDGRLPGQPSRADPAARARHRLRRRRSRVAWRCRPDRCRPPTPTSGTPGTRTSWRPRSSCVCAASRCAPSAAVELACQRGGSAGSDHSNDCSISVSLGLCSNDSIVAWMRWTAAMTASSWAAVPSTRASR